MISSLSSFSDITVIFVFASYGYVLHLEYFICVARTLILLETIKFI